MISVLNTKKSVPNSNKAISSKVNKAMAMPSTIKPMQNCKLFKFFNFGINELYQKPTQPKSSRQIKLFFIKIKTEEICHITN